MNMKFDFRTKLLVIVLTMSLVAVLKRDILIYTLLGVLSVYLIIQGFGRQTIKYLIVCGVFIVLRLISGGQGITILMPEMFLFGASYFNDGYGGTACDWYATRRSSCRFQENTCS